MDPTTFLATEALQEEDRVRSQWIQDVPHTPEPELEGALARAAFPTKDSKDLVILTSGTTL